MGLSGKLQHPEQCRAWAASGQSCLAAVPSKTEAQHSGSASSVSPVVPDAHPVPQFSRAILTCPRHPSTRAAPLLQSLPRHLKVRLALHLTLPCREVSSKHLILSLLL